MPVQPKQPLALDAVVKIAQSYNTASASLCGYSFFVCIISRYTVVHMAVIKVFC